MMIYFGQAISNWMVWTAGNNQEAGNRLILLLACETIKFQWKCDVIPRFPSPCPPAACPPKWSPARVSGEIINPSSSSLYLCRYPAQRQHGVAVVWVHVFKMPIIDPHSSLLLAKAATATAASWHSLRESGDRRSHSLLRRHSRNIITINDNILQSFYTSIGLVTSSVPVPYTRYGGVRHLLTFYYYYYAFIFLMFIY